MKRSPDPTSSENIITFPTSGLPRQYYRPSEVAKVTGLSRSTVFAAIYSGELKAFQRGRAWLVPVEEVDRWIQGDGNVA